MNITGAFILLLAVASIVAIAKLAKAARRNKQTKSDPYKDIHLGEMTHHDLPRFSKRTGSSNWDGRSSDTEKKGRKGNSYEKGKSKNQN